ncbi:hypothetical protein [Sphingobacterium mizutaii]|uniref:hypothetical protein n=1 Tax=Sphingobacterium mizutaii TaxID=1010 RepID=UPI003D9662CD
MYSAGTGIVYGFHGCDRSIAEEIINQKLTLKNSENEYDWLGNGMYFWENSPSRALEYAENLKANPERAKHPVKDPCVIGAIIHLGNCLDLLDYENLKILKAGFELLKATTDKLPKNIAIGKLNELMVRKLDCAVIQTIHEVRREEMLREFDSVRGVFWEGAELYPNAGFREKDHIQLCIRNPNCIKGYFYPRKVNTDYYEL